MVAVFAFLSLFFQLEALADPPGAAKAAPEIQCPVEGISGKEKEASSAEASRRAGTIWSNVRATTESDLGTNWIPIFLRCAKIAGLPLETFALDRSIYDSKIKIALANARKKITKETDPKIQKLALENYEKKSQEILGLDPSLKTIVAESAFLAEDKSKIEKTYSELLEKEKTECTPVDFSHRLGPVRDQTDKGWCYAFSAADLVSARLGPDTNNFSRKVSASDIAFQYNFQNISWFERFFFGKDLGSEEGGMMGEALKAALKKGGYCLEKNAPSENFQFGRLNDTIRDIRSIVEAQSPSADQFCFTYLRVQDMFPGVDLDAYADILNATQGDNYKHFRQLNEQNCEGKRHSYGLKSEDIVDANKKTTSVDAMIGSIDHQLGKKNPLAIGFHSKMIGDYSGNHATLVVGRRYDAKTQTCQYLLRNSWGTSCGGQLNKKLCAPEHLGHLWVSREMLKENLFHLTYLRPEDK